MSSSGEMREDIVSVNSDRLSSLKLINKISSKTVGQYTSDQTWEHFVDLVHLPHIVVQFLPLIFFFRNDASHICTQNNRIVWVFLARRNFAVEMSDCDMKRWDLSKQSLSASPIPLPLSPMTHKTAIKEKNEGCEVYFHPTADLVKYYRIHLHRKTDYSTFPLR